MFRSLRRRSLRAQKSRYEAQEAPNLIEKLEQKQLLVGQVQAIVRGDNLYIRGEESANQVEVAFHEGHVAVRPKQGTRINGVRGRFIAFENTDTVPGSIFVNMGHGDDTVILSSGLKVQKDVMVNGRQGNDTLGLDNAIVRDDVIFLGGTGDDSVSIEDSRVVHVLKLKMSDGDDLIRVVNSEVRGHLQARGAQGDDSVVLDGADVDGHVQLRMHRGNDVIDIQNSHVEGRFRVSTRLGDDSVLIDNSTFEYTSVVNLGRGDDNLALGEGDGNGDDTPASGNVFKRAFVGLGRGGTDNFQVDVGTEFRGARRDSSFEGDTFTGDTSDAIDAADDVRDAIRNFIDVELTARIATSADDVIATGTGDTRLFTTTSDTITISGVTDAGADLEVDANGDGTFDEATGRADRDGTFEIQVPLVAGQQTVDIRNADQTGESRQFEVHRSLGTVIRMTSDLGDIDIELLNDDAPVTVANFLSYFDEYGDNSIIHRAPEDFVIQGGGFTVDGEETTAIPTGDPIDTEFNADNSNVRGTLSMALLGGQPNSGTSGWFINLTDNSGGGPDLDGNQHTVFGRVIGGPNGAGMDVADAIDALPKFDVGLSDGANTPLQDFEETSGLTGTLSIPDGSVNVTGTGTQFLSELTSGDQINVGSQMFEVESIGGNDSLVVTSASNSEVTNQAASVDNVPDEDNFLVFSDIAVLLEQMN